MLHKTVNFYSSTLLLIYALQFHVTLGSGELSKVSYVETNEKDLEKLKPFSRNIVPNIAASQDEEDDEPQQKKDKDFKKCNELADCRLQIDEKFDKIHLCYYSGARIIGNCTTVYPSTAKFCNRAQVIGCHRFPPMAKALLEALEAEENTEMDEVPLLLVILPEGWQENAFDDSSTTMTMLGRYVRTRVQDGIVFVGGLRQQQQVQNLVDEAGGNVLAVGLVVLTDELSDDDDDDATMEKLNEAIFESVRERAAGELAECSAEIGLSDTSLAFRICQFETLVSKVLETLDMDDRAKLRMGMLKTADKFPRSSFLVRKSSDVSAGIMSFLISDSAKEYLAELVKVLESSETFVFHPRQSKKSSSSRTLENVWGVKLDLIRAALRWPMWFKSKLASAENTNTTSGTDTSGLNSDGLTEEESSTKSEFLLTRPISQEVTAFEPSSPEIDTVLTSHESAEQEKGDGNASTTSNGKSVCRLHMGRNLCFDRHQGKIAGCSLEEDDNPLSSCSEDSKRPRTFFSGSSSWPWFDLTVQIHRSCRCLRASEVFTLTGHLVGRPCTQPVPWCYVVRGSACPDAAPAYAPGGLEYSVVACARETAVRPPYWRYF